MNDDGNEIKHLGNIDGARIAVQITGSRQSILVEDTPRGRHLVRLLGSEPNHLPATRVDGTTYRAVPHDANVDDFLKQAIDIFISIRYLHPTFVQLRMELD